MPEGKEAGGVLPGLIAVMTYLAVLSAASGLAVYNVTQGWSTDLARSMTVQVVHQDRAERSEQPKVTAIGTFYLATFGTDGIIRHPVSRATTGTCYMHFRLFP